MRTYTASALLLAVLSCSPVLAQEWATKMFQTTHHDFGSVARNAHVEYEFKLTNIYKDDVHIAGVRSSCGCTSPRIRKKTLKTYEQGAIVAHINTDKFLGRKGATLTVTIDKPLVAEVQLHVKTSIHDDVVVQPGSVQLGTVDQGNMVEKRVNVRCGGADNWRVLEVRSPNSHLAGKLVETGRSSGQTSYLLLVRLGDTAPVGYIKDHLMLRVTNDRQSMEVPVLVEGRVQAGLTVSPGMLFMGVMAPGQKVSKRLVLQSRAPFRIKEVTCQSDRDRFRFDFDHSAKATPKLIHLITVTFVAPNEPGRPSDTIRITTDRGSTATEVHAGALVAQR